MFIFNGAPPYKIEEHLKSYLESSPKLKALYTKNSHLYFFRDSPSQLNISHLINEKGLLSYARQLESTQKNLKKKIQQLEEEVIQRQLMEKELRYRERFNERIAYTLPQVLSIFDLHKQKMVFANTRLSELSGYPKEELLSMELQNLLSLLHPDDLENQMQVTTRWKNMEDDQISTSEYRLKTIDNSWKWFSARDAVFQRSIDGKVIQIIRTSQDITEQKQLEAQLLQSQKMEAIGRLAGGIAHDFNNLLTSLMGYSTLLIEKLESQPELKAYAERIQQTGIVASSLTRQLLGLSRKNIIKNQNINLNQLIYKMKFILQSLLGEEIELILNLGNLSRAILADSSQIEQIVLNLAVNARDSMTKGGILTIEVEQSNDLTMELKPQIGKISKGTYIILTVQDTGVGIKKNVIQHIFEPFFTTKESHLGTGLGLSTVANIVEHLNGAITLDSQLKQGTTFKIYLPCHDSIETSHIQNEDQYITYKGNGTILIVENDPEILELSQLLLENCGYTVISANNPLLGIEQMKKEGSNIDLILTDIIMPQMNGVEMALCIQELFPDIPILFMTGYSNEAYEINSIPITKADLIQKPFSPQGLESKVKKMLAKN